MVGLYKDPKGETVTTFGTKEETETKAVENSGREKEDEIKNLRRRITELETIVKTNVCFLCIFTTALVVASPTLRHQRNLT